MLHLPDIIEKTQQSFQAVDNYCKNILEEKFFIPQAAGKWSVAQHIEHLSVSTATSSLAFRLPKLVVGWIGGTTNRPSVEFQELVNNYKGKLAAGSKATGRYIPKSELNTSQSALLQRWQEKSNQYMQYLTQQHNEKALDKYCAPHPILGKITLRELAYFTIYHTGHHLQIIQQRIEE
jgi:hypothetical protein